MKVRVYYADTDAGGVTYYANYLRWMEMARFEWIESMDASVTKYAEQGFIFAVAHLEIDYHLPTVLGDELEIQTEVERVRHVRFMLKQQVVRLSDDQPAATATLTMACVTPQGKPQALPDDLAASLRDRLP